jgi:hypothetical protein
MLALLFIAALVGGLLMFKLCSGDWKEIGKMLLFSAILSFLIVIAPAAVKLLHG